MSVNSSSPDARDELTCGRPAGEARASGTARPKSYLPKSERTPSALVHAGVPTVVRLAPRSHARRRPAPVAERHAGGSGERWPWYRPVTVALLAMAAVAISIVGLRGEDGAAGGRVPITDPAELKTTGAKALALVAYPWRDLGYRVVFAPGRANVRAQTDRATKTITVFLTKGDAPHRVAHDIAHEFGHAYDDQYLTDDARNAYLRARGVPDAPWWPGEQFSDYSTGAGDFAEVFALCHAASPEFRSLLARVPPQPCSLILKDSLAGR